jgi:hypothetical protein
MPDMGTCPTSSRAPRTNHRRGERGGEGDEKGREQDKERVEKDLLFIIVDNLVRTSLRGNI